MAPTLPTPEGYTLMRFFSKKQFQRYLDFHKIPYLDIAITNRDVTVVLPCSAYDLARRYGARPADTGPGPQIRGQARRRLRPRRSHHPPAPAPGGGAGRTHPHPHPRGRRLMNAPTDYPLPVIHLNGTGRDTLLREYYAAYKAAKQALTALQDVTCHARDYYVSGEGAYYKAHDVRSLHLRRLHDIVEYLGSHINHIAGHTQVPDGRPN